MKKTLAEIPSTFREVMEMESAAVAESRRHRGRKDGSTIGLALSGGGIRSATFNLGVIQGLAKLNLLNRFDYLSTVSGGGYIGSWLVAWLKRTCTPDRANPDPIEMVTRLLVKSGEDEVKEIRWLRKHSNYLTPKLGLFGADTWTVVATYTRNLVLNLLILVLALSAVITLPHILVVCAVNVSQSPDAPGTLRTVMTWSGLSLLWVASFFVVYNLSALGISIPRYEWLMKQSRVQAFIVIPILLAAIPAMLYVATLKVGDLPRLGSWLMIPTELYVGIWFIGGFLVYIFQNISDLRLNVPIDQSVPLERDLGSVILKRFVFLLSSWKTWLPIVAAIFIAGALTGLLMSWAIPVFVASSDDVQVRSRIIMVFGFPGIVLILSTAVVVQIGIMGLNYSEDMREWWSRLGAWFMIYAISWTALFATAVYANAALSKVESLLVRAAAGGAWIVSTISGVLIGRSKMTRLADNTSVRDVAGRAAPFIFAVGLLLLLSCLVYYVIHADALWNNGQDAIWVPVGLFFSTGVVACILSSRVDVNEFSMHAMYRNRLIRCYLGASNEERVQHPFTGFDRNDDIQMVDLQGTRGYSGPYPIVNTTLNLVHGKDLALQERKAASFVFTPLYAGYDDVYRRTGEEFSLGTAVAISGAAASPNMGYHSSAALAFLMTVFNVRLGWWYRNPKRGGSVGSRGPRLGLFYLLRELSGSTNDESNYVYLSDGGHFENLGLYELVRRRCKCIVVCDAGEDREASFGDLGGAIEKCRVDLGVEINIEMDDLRIDPATGKSKSHCAIGRIAYPNNDGNKGLPRSGEGILVYLKATLTGREPVDVSAYKRHHPDFPHESTVDQWFSESQFESYRKLGIHSVLEVFDKASSNKRSLNRFF